MPMRCRSTGIGSSMPGSRCNTSPTVRLSRIAVCAATTERCRPSVIGNTVPGNRTRLRVGIRISASSGNAATAADPISTLPGERGRERCPRYVVPGPPKAWRISSRLVQLQHQAAIGEMPAGEFEPGRRQLDPSLKMPVRNLQPVDPGILRIRRAADVRR